MAKNRPEEKENDMALTRKLLESMGLEGDKVVSIIEAHSETVEGLKEKIKTYKADADALKETKEKLEKAEGELNSLREAGGDWEKKYNDEHKAFEEFKNAQTKEAESRAKADAYRRLLTEVGVSEKRIDSVIKITDVDSLEYKDGEFTDVEKLKESIAEEWADFITNRDTSGASTEKPQGNADGKLSKTDIFKIKDATERQKAIQENPELFS